MADIPSRLAWTAITIVLISVLPLFAQGVGDTTGTLTGNVQDDAERPLPGVIITASGAAGAKTTTSDVEGKFIFPFLIPGSYSVKAELQGFNTVEQEEVPIHLDQRTEVSFRMKAVIRESIEIIGEVPLIDLTSTTTGANITDQLIQRIPLGRSFTSVINLAPGVSDAGVGGNLSISGASGLENTYLVDGVNITDPGFGAIGAYSITYGSLSSGFPPDFMKEVQVKSGGFEPEYGEALGGVVNVITKTGGNHFTGEGYVYYSPGSLEGSRKLVDFDEFFVTNVGEVKSVDGGLNLAGPILKNKLFFFGAYNPRRVETTFLNDPDAPQFTEFPEGTNVRTTHSYAAKLTANLSKNHTLEFSTFGDPSRSPLANQNGQGLDSGNPIVQQSQLKYGNESQVGRWNGILRSNMFVEGQIARSHNEFKQILGPAGDQWLVFDRTSFPNVVSGGIGGFEAGSIGTNLQYGLKLTNLWRSHEFRYGIQLEDIDYRSGREISGPTFTAFNGEQTSTGAVVVIRHDDRFPDLEKVYIAFSALSPPLRLSSTKYLNWFAQDSWNITPDLNLNLGVRWERQQIKGNLEGSEDVTLPDNWAPRLGATYDYLHNGKSKAFFHYGRFFEKIPNALATLGLSGSRSLTAFYYDPGLTQPIPGVGGITDSQGEAVEGLGSSTSPHKTHSQYSDEWVGGIEQEVKRDLSVGVSFIYRNVGNVLEDIFVNRDAPCVQLSDGRCVPPGMRAEDFLTSNGAFFITNLDGHYPGFPKLVRRYKALEITAEKRFSSRWQILASYRYAQLVGNYEGLFRRDNGQSAPHLTSIDFAESPYLGFTYDKGPLPNDIRHSIKLHGSYQWNMGLNTGLSFNFSSGRPITELGAIPFYGEDERLKTPRGALGRTDSITTLDLHADYAVPIGKGRQDLSFGLDVFNLFDSQSVITVVQSSEFQNGTFNPDPKLDFLKPSAYQDPRSIRFVLRYSF